MWTRSRFVNEYVPGLFAVAVDSYLSKRGELMYPKLCTIKDSKKKKEEDAIRSGLGDPAAKGEGAGITYDVQIAGAKQSWVHAVYALGVRITEEAIEDNLYELGGGGNAEDLKEMFFDLGESLAVNPEKLAARFFNFGTATTYHTTRDGVALFSASHTRLDGSTYSNYLTSTDLTYSTYWSAVIAAENQYNHRQQRIQKKVRKLWVPPQLEKNAREVVYSPDRPDTGNRAINAMKQSGRTVEICVWPYLSDTDAWFLQTDGRGIIMFWRRKTRFGREQDFQTGDMMAKGDQRFSMEIADERDFIGVIPA
jgi:hypothetical protein